MLSRLSDFLRLTLEGGDEREVPLDDELAFVQRYLEIERVRFGERLGVRLDISAEVIKKLDSAKPPAVKPAAATKPPGQ